MTLKTQGGAATKKSLRIALLVGGAAFLASCLPMTKLEFRFVSGKEYCRVLDLPPPYPLHEVPPQPNGVGSLRYHRRPGLPNSIFAVFHDPPHPATYLPTSQLGWIINFPQKELTTFQTSPSEWKSWGPPIEIGGGDLSTGNRFVGAPYGSEASETKEIELLRRYPSSGDAQLGYYSANNNYVRIVSDKVTEVTGRDTSGYTYFEIFRVRDRRLLVKLEYKRTLSGPVGPAGEFHDGGYGYFHPVHDWAEKGVVCYFPPELFR